MFGINKRTEEVIDDTKKDIKDQINSLVEDGRVWSIGLLAAGCLTVGYILGALTTGAMCRTMVVFKK